MTLHAIARPVQKPIGVCNAGTRRRTTRKGRRLCGLQVRHRTVWQDCGDQAVIHGCEPGAGEQEWVQWGLHWWAGDNHRASQGLLD